MPTLPPPVADHGQSLVWCLPDERPDPHAAVPPSPQFTAWAAHVDAGRIGAPPPVDPEVAARRDAMCRLFVRPVGRW